MTERVRECVRKNYYRTSIFYLLCSTQCVQNFESQWKNKQTASTCTYPGKLLGKAVETHFFHVEGENVHRASECNSWECLAEKRSKLKQKSGKGKEERRAL